MRVFGTVSALLRYTRSTVPKVILMGGFQPLRRLSVFVVTAHPIHLRVMRSGNGKATFERQRRRRRTDQGVFCELCCGITTKFSGHAAQREVNVWVNRWSNEGEGAEKSKYTRARMRGLALQLSRPASDSLTIVGHQARRQMESDCPDRTQPGELRKRLR